MVLLHGQQPSGIAEVFPRDLRTTQVTFESIVDTVEIALVGLPQPIPAGTQFQARAQLAAQFASGQSLPSLPSDSIPLGVVAIPARTAGMVRSGAAQPSAARGRRWQRCHG